MLDRLAHNLALRLRLKQPRTVLDGPTLMGVLARMVENYKGSTTRAVDDAPIVAALIMEYDALHRARAAMWERRQEASVNNPTVV